MPYAIGNPASSVTPVMIRHVSLPSHVGVIESIMLSLNSSCFWNSSNAPTPKSNPSNSTYNMRENPAKSADKSGKSINDSPRPRSRSDYLAHEDEMRS